jgi:hypothetical protein
MHKGEPRDVLEGLYSVGGIQQDDREIVLYEI